MLKKLLCVLLLCALALAPTAYAGMDMISRVDMSGLTLTAGEQMPHVYTTILPTENSSVLAFVTQWVVLRDDGSPSTSYPDGEQVNNSVIRPGARYGATVALQAAENCMFTGDVKVVLDGKVVPVGDPYTDWTKSFIPYRGTATSRVTMYVYFGQPEIPATGDAENIALYAAVALTALAGLSAVVFHKRKMRVR